MTTMKPMTKPYPITESQLEYELSQHTTGFKYIDDRTEIYQPYNVVGRSVIDNCLRLGRKESNGKYVTFAFIDEPFNILKNDEDGKITYTMSAPDIGRIGEVRHIKIEFWYGELMEMYLERDELVMEMYLEKKRRSA